jgi:hypothetical protein
MGTEWRESTDSRWRSATDRDRRVLAVARTQHQLATSGQLREIGFSPGAIAHRINAGRWFAVHSGVYSLSPPPLTADARLMAAVLACGGGSAVSDFAAAWLLGFWNSLPPLLDVTNGSGRGRGRAGICVHRRRLAPLDLTRRRGIPTVTATRTVADLAARLRAGGLEQAVMIASSRRLIDERRLRELAADRSRRGSRLLRAVLGIEVPFVRSQIEAAFMQICTGVGVDPPLVNRSIVVSGRRFEPDFQWPALRLIVEVDGYAFHGGRTQANADRDREQLLALAGWLVHRFTRDQIVSDPREVGRRVLALYRRRRRRSVAEIHRQTMEIRHSPRR